MYRHLADRERQVKLSSVRTEARRQRVENGVPKPKELDEYARPEKGKGSLITVSEKNNSSAVRLQHSNQFGFTTFPHFPLLSWQVL